MAKRFTDTEKWKDDWYISLSNDNKIVWQWLLDNCTIAGVCKPSIGLLNLMCRTTYTENQLIEEMGGRLIVYNRIWFIPKFIKFQYSTLLSSKPAIISVVRELFEYNLVSMIPKSFGNHYEIITESFNNHCQMIKDKDKVKDKVKDKEMYLGKNEIKKLKGVSFSKNGDKVFFEDKSSQELGKDQKALFDMGVLKPNDITKGLKN
jgi:hypothetical protein